MINPDSFKGCINDNYHTYFPIISQNSMCVFINYLQPENVMIDCIFQIIFKENKLQI